MVIIVFILILIKQFFWWKTVPIFQTPDEQAHFAQLQWYAEKKTLTINSEKNLSLEVATAEELLGTRRDNFGNNKYTYHPEYKNNAVIPKMPRETRTIYVDKEAANYPPLYYLLALPFYNLVYDNNLVDRIISVRLLSLVFGLGLAMAAYKIGRIIWEEKLFALTLAIMVSFQPMVSFVSAGFHPDNLLNLISTVTLGVCLLILKNGVKIKYLGALILLFLLGMETKPFMVFLLPVVLAVVLPWPLAIGALLSPVLVFVLKLPVPYMPNITINSPLVNMDFIEYLKFRVPKSVFEMWPWYWGVFKWLGVTLPPIVMKIITRVAIISGLGLAIKFFQKNDFEKKSLIFFLLATISYVLYIFLWDFRLMQSVGFSLGLQGRYLLPTILPEMVLLLVGASTLFGRFKKIGAVILSIAMIILNGIALYVIYQSYYEF